jgi:hypothetical protein
MGVNTVDYMESGSANTDRRPSPALWGDFPEADFLHEPSKGVHHWDDFTRFPLIGTQTTEIAHGGYKVFATSGGSVLPISAVNSIELGGGILQLGADTDNDSVSLADSYPSLMMTGLTTNSGKLWFECRVALSSILTNTVGFFAGLAEVEQWTLATGVPFNGGDAITNSAAAIGFRKEEDGLGVIDTVYSDRATSFTNIGDSATSVAANTFIKLGMKYDPENISECVKFYANNQLVGTAMTRAALLALTNLDANALGFLIALITDSSGTAAKLYLDWVRYAQILPTTATV